MRARCPRSCTPASHDCAVRSAGARSSSCRLCALPLAVVATALLAYRLASAQAARSRRVRERGRVARRRLAPRTRAHDSVDLARTQRSMQRRRTLEDSATLALAGDDAPRTRLERLQQARIRQRRLELALPDLRPAWPRRSVHPPGRSRCWRSRWRSPRRRSCSRAARRRRRRDPDVAGGDDACAPARSRSRPLRTRDCSRREVGSLDAQAPAGSRIAWTIELDRDAVAASLRFHDGSTTGAARRTRRVARRARARHLAPLRNGAGRRATHRRRSALSHRRRP